MAIDLRDLDLGAWRSRLTAVFQDFIRFELAIAGQRRPRRRTGYGGARRASSRRALAISQARTLCWRAVTKEARTYRAGNGSASRWRERCARCELGAGVVLLDEPTAQLDVRGEAEIFDRFSTPRGTARRSSSRTVSRRCDTPIAFACSSRAA